jgi:hypothetical protein
MPNGERREKQQDEALLPARQPIAWSPLTCGGKCPENRHETQGF